MGIRFTHGYDLIYRLALIGGGIGAASTATETIAQPLLAPLERVLTSLEFQWLWSVGVIVYAFGAFIGSIFLLTKTVLPEWLPTMLYLRVGRGTSVSRNEAEKLSFLLNGSMGGLWYPLHFLNRIDPEFRREALLQFANRVARENKWMPPFTDAEPRTYGPRQTTGTTGQREMSGADKRRHAESAMSPLEQEVAAKLRILGLDKMPADFENIKKAYRRRISQYHPDKFMGERPEVRRYAEDQAKEITTAYAFLEEQFGRRAA